MEKASGIGYGKTILFGEHFVVYGLSAIASAISSKTIAEIEASETFEFADNRPETPGYKIKKKDEISRQLKSLKERFKDDKVKITLSGDLTCSSGVGASAALAASIAKAYNHYLGLNLSEDEINSIAYEAECAGSGKASGIDNTCSVYGGFIIFQKNLQGKENKIEKIPVENPIDIVMASSGITQTTKEVVEDIRRLRDENPIHYKRIFTDYLQVFNDAVSALKAGDNKLLGSLMDSNQKLLSEMTLSCPELEDILSCAKTSGALGAKLTGTGRGGTVIALTPGQELQEKVANAIENKGYKCHKTKIGG
jgi:mevalonate kinase